MNGSFLVILLGIPGILVATTVHEFVRALTSTVLGDTYPKSQGQVTLNPVKHFEPIGFLMMLYSGGFGWGKPVETSALYYKKQKKRYASGCDSADRSQSHSGSGVPFGLWHIPEQGVLYRHTASLSGIL